ncbi:hypothetical protein BST61_g8898 [Cercospora zeina]
MAALPVRGPPPASPPPHSGKRRSRKSTVGEAGKPQPKRPRPRSTQATSTHRHHLDTPSAESSRLRVNLYDAVAGRAGYEGLLLDRAGAPLPPDQILFHRAGAPIRYEETDPYFAHRYLAPDQRLPESDMLKAVHAYAADFYASGVLGDCRLDLKSLDETALIALGILLEEAAAQSLEQTGDLAFVEGLERPEGP